MGQRGPDGPSLRPTAARSLDYARAIRRGVDLRYLVAHGAAHLVPPLTAGPLTARIYRAGGVRIGGGSSIGGPLRLIGGTAMVHHLAIGRDVLIGTDVAINLDDEVRIGDGATIGPFVIIYTSTHRMGPSARRLSLDIVTRPVVVESGAWVALRATLLPGVTVGRGSVVGAGSVVTDDVPPNTLVAGNPARVVRPLPDD
jgi:acetyltransferase-like isoleucine patch superfamily enzyme